VKATKIKNTPAETAPNGSPPFGLEGDVGAGLETAFRLVETPQLGQKLPSSGTFVPHFGQ